MIRSFVINKYLSKEFFKVILNVSISFFCLGFIINLFEEINFFKDFDVGISVPLLLSLMFVPSMLYKMFPFVILISGIWFFLRIKKTDEIIALKVSGMSNFSVILVPCFVSILLGIFFITSINPITSILVKKYETIRGSYEKDQNYLAALTVNGIWIKEKNYNKNYIIRSKNLDDTYLNEVTIYEFDSNNFFLKRIEADSADISSLTWKMKNARVIDNEGKIIFENDDNVIYQSKYDIEKIKSLYANLDTVSFWNIENEIKLLEKRGYSTNEMRAKFHRSISFPLFLLSMVLLSGVFTIGTQTKESNWSYIFIAIISSVLVFYFNDFSAALGKTDKLPVEVAVWMPILLIFIFGSVGLIHANQK